MKESEDQRGRLGRKEVAASRVYERQNGVKGFWASISRLLNKKVVKITLRFLLTLFVLTGLSVLYYSWDHHVIVQGVKISGMNVSNLSEEQAKVVIDNEAHRLMNQTVKLNLGQLSQEVTLKELGLVVTADSALQLAYQYGRTGSIFSKVFSKITASKGVDLDLSQEWNDKVLTETITQKFNGYSKLATDASFQITPQNTMLIKGEQVGRVLDTEALSQTVKGINPYKPVSEIDIQSKEQNPSITAAQLEKQKITGLLSTYTTRFDPSQTARSEKCTYRGKGFRWSDRKT
ncbi:Vancomycin B-type resistance protein VanW [Desulfosporosinus sp. I2]|uniref:peptidoglycan binding domain-containing protein n=1 Tax=Desulfosporosinus sp. I2 TaxID=1617025 RepID=UPI00061FF33F|nr:peptidoglycan binding domain-containing protein [Desulfosporosinus sp. I2]KJR47634.1 Vancomycin B-type resistance protein VanW [Desulfosporosinus sp. I2]